MTNRWFSNIGNGTETGKTGSVHVSVDRSEIVKSAILPPSIAQYIPPISVYKRNTQLFHIPSSTVFQGSDGRDGKRERGRDEWIRIILIVAGRRVSRLCHFPIGYVCIHTLDYFIPAVVGIESTFRRKKIGPILCFHFFKALVEIKTIPKFSESHSNREQRVERILDEFSWYFLKHQRDARKRRIRISKVEVFFFSRSVASESNHPCNEVSRRVDRRRKRKRIPRNERKGEEN